MATIRSLTDNDPTFKAVWQWARQLVIDLNKAFASQSKTPVGVVSPYAGSTAPTGWLLCDGSAYSKTDYPELFLCLNYAYGGSGDTFLVPDFRDRAPVGAGSLALGHKDGAATKTLSVDEMPTHTHVVDDPKHTHVFTADPHNHVVNDPQHTHALNDPGHVHGGGAAGTTNSMAAGAVANVAAQANTAAATTGITVTPAVTGVTLADTVVTGTNAPSSTGITLENTGGGKAFSILNPVLAVNYIIKA